MRRVVVTVKRLVAGAVAGLVGWAGMVQFGIGAAADRPGAAATSSTFSAPVYDGDFPDPTVLVGSTYWGLLHGQRRQEPAGDVVE
jgi:hypothetical protein